MRRAARAKGRYAELAMNTTSNHAYNRSDLIGPILTSLAVLLTLPPIGLIVFFATQPPMPGGHNMDLGGLSYFIPLLFFSYCLFTVLAFTVGCFTMLSSSKRVKGLFMALMLVLIASALLAAWRIVGSSGPPGGWAHWWSPLLALGWYAAIPAPPRKIQR